MKFKEAEVTYTVEGLRATLDKHGFTQKEFANAARVSEGYLSDVIHGRRNVTKRMKLIFEKTLAEYK